MALAPLALGIFVATLGYSSYRYYPTLGAINLCAAGWAALAVLALLLCAPAAMGLIKRRIDLD